MGRSNTAYGHRDSPHPDVGLAELAARQHGIVSHRQLTELGIRGTALTRRIASARLHRRHRGVYAVGHPRPSREGRWLAAVFAAGPGAVLSHRDAAALWGLLDSARAVVDVSTPRRSRARVEGVQLHRPRRLDPADTTRVGVIPVTTVARTLIDLTDVLHRRKLERAVREAGFLRVLELDAIDASLARAHGRHRLHWLHTALESHRPRKVLRSELEHRFLELCRAGGVPEPDTNAQIRIGGRTLVVDCLWGEQLVVVELDGAAAHATPRAFEADRARDAALTAAGLRPLRFTWLRIEREPAAVVAQLRQTLRLAVRSSPVARRPQSSTPSSRRILRRIASDDA